MPWDHKDLLDTQQLNPADISQILKTALSMKEILARPIKKLPTLRGKSVCTLFYEASTRTRMSFEAAAKILSADTTSFAVATSSVTKGETLLDTAKTLQAMKFDLVVIRHPSSGAATFLAQKLEAGVINGGDGQRDHPSQALLDAFTIYEKMGIFDKKSETDHPLAGQKILLVGDVLHSRVARSNAICLTKLGAEVVLIGPPTLVPPEMAYLGVRTAHDLDSELPGADVIMALRLQLERQQKGLFPSIREYANLYGLTPGRLAKTGKETLVLHPGPMNRGVEIDSLVADGLQSAIEEQVTNGVAVRMALIYLMIGGGTGHVVD